MKRKNDPRESTQDNTGKTPRKKNHLQEQICNINHGIQQKTMFFDTIL